MTWTYIGSPGTSTAAERRDAVRMLIGDTNTNDQQVSDEEIAFALSEVSDDIYTAAATMARAVAAKYSRLVDTAVEGLKADYSQRQQHYRILSWNLEKEAKKRGAGVGVPVAGGISLSEMDSVEDDSDRPSPAFRRGQFTETGSSDLDSELIRSE